MSILSPAGREWRRGDHATCHGQPYTVLSLDLDGVRAQLVPGNRADLCGAYGRIFVPVAELAWRA